MKNSLLIGIVLVLSACSMEESTKETNKATTILESEVLTDNQTKQIELVEA